MADYTNSTLANWIDWKPTVEIPHCQRYAATLSAPLEVVNCSQVCNNSTLLFDPQFQSSNLVNCGVWSALVISASQFETVSDTSISITDISILNDLELYEVLGLGATDYEHASKFADVISTCLTYIYTTAVSYSFHQDDMINLKCTKPEMFPAMLSSRNLAVEEGRSALRTCLDALCSPRILDPDLAGIGVYISFIIQSAIAVSFGLLLMAVAKLPTRTKEEKKSLRDALTNFHKAQCYLTSAFQITALVLVGRTLHAVHASPSIDGPFPDFFDTSVLILLAVSGLIPITIGLLVIQSFGEQDWFVLILSSITWFLAGLTSAFATFINKNYAEPLDSYGSLSDLDYSPSTSCAIPGNVGESLFPLCGSWRLDNNSLENSVTFTPMIWMVWTSSTLLLFWIVGSKLVDQKYKGNHLLSRWLATFYREPRDKDAPHSPERLFLFSILSLSFTGQLGLLSIYIKHDLISYRWTFAQLIAVTVWVPSIIEFIYVEYRE